MKLAVIIIITMVFSATGLFADDQQENKVPAGSKVLSDSLDSAFMADDAAGTKPSAPLKGNAVSGVKPADVPTSNTNEKSFAIILQNGKYYPSTIYLYKGMPTRLYVTNSNNAEYSIVSDTFGFQKGVSRGKITEITFTPDREGIYKFYCPISKAEGYFVVLVK